MGPPQGRIIPNARFENRPLQEFPPSERGGGPTLAQQHMRRPMPFRNFRPENSNSRISNTDRVFGGGDNNNRMKMPPRLDMRGPPGPFEG